MQLPSRPYVKILKVQFTLPRELLIHTYLQIGGDGGRKFPEPFQRFAAASEKPFKRFQKLPNVPDTQLKQGVNESLWGHHTLSAEDVIASHPSCAKKGE